MTDADYIQQLQKAARNTAATTTPPRKVRRAIETVAQWVCRENNFTNRDKKPSGENKTSKN